MSTHNIPFSLYERKSPNFLLHLQLWDCFKGTQERIRNSRGKRAISVRATEVLLSMVSYSIQANAYADLILQSNARFTHYREADSP